MKVTEEHVSEIDDNIEDPDYEASCSDENETPNVDPPVVSQPPTNPLPSKNGKLSWSRLPPEQQGRRSAANVIKMVPGPIRYTVSHLQDIKSAFHLFITPSIEKNILEMTNLKAYIGLLILAGVYKAKGEATASLWNADTGRAKCNMPLRGHIL